MHGLCLLHVLTFRKSGHKGKESFDGIVIALQFPSFGAQFGVLEVAVNDEPLHPFAIRRVRIFFHGIFECDDGAFVLFSMVIEIGRLKGLYFKFVPEFVNHNLAGISVLAGRVAIQEELELFDGLLRFQLIELRFGAESVTAHSAFELCCLCSRIIGKSLGEHFEIVPSEVVIANASVRFCVLVLGIHRPLRAP